MTVNEVITSVRRHIRDTTTGNYSWPDAELIQYTNEGQKVVFRAHPESVITSTTTVTPQWTLTELTSTGQTLEVSDFWGEDVINYVIQRALNKYKTKK